jgi:nucleotide-binding universal stress UspA family protein
MVGMAAQTRRILVGYDGSEPAERALERAADLTGYGSTLTVVTVAAEEADDAQGLLSRARELLLHRHVPASYVERSGAPAAELVGAAAALEADLVVVGRRSRSLRRLVLGSVSADVVRDAPCDVLVVR